MKKLSDCRVLLVDDAKTNLDILVEGLKGDHKLSVAMNGESALQIAARTPPDLVLLDIVMPGLDGYEVCGRLRRMPETADVPIMFLSSLEEVQNKTRGFEAGANDYLTKPFDSQELLQKVASSLARGLHRAVHIVRTAARDERPRFAGVGVVAFEMGAACGLDPLTAYVHLVPRQSSRRCVHVFTPKCAG